MAVCYWKYEVILTSKNRQCTHQHNSHRVRVGLGNGTGATEEINGFGFLVKLIEWYVLLV